MKLNKLLLLVLFVFFGSAVFAQSSSAELKRQKEALQRKIDLLQKNAAKAANNKKLTLTQIRSINTKIGLMQSKISVINSEIKNLDVQIHENTNTVHTLKGQLGQLKKEYANMIRFAQRNRGSYDKMMFIFASSDFNQAYKRIKYLQQFGQYRKKQADYISGKQKDLNYKIVVLDKNLKEKSNLLHEQEDVKNKLGKDKSAQSQVLNKFSKEERTYRQDLEVSRKRQAQLDREIRAAIARDIARDLAIAKKKAEDEQRAAAAKAKAENKPIPVAKVPSSGNYIAPTPESAKLSSGFEGNRGSLPWPVAAGNITERFGVHTVGQAKYTNDGVTIETTENATVRAVFNGKVTRVINSYNRVVILINHGQYYTVYQNLKSASVSVGDNVTTKQAIGVVANSEDTPQMQFQIFRGAAAQNPESWISNR
ncbi:murein hydrolase activator EnvC family protein [Pedobacter metabolipauper]|uniref:Septal ring factor EnvC (AmiA/AmiB activator) n=1 Tax=Pedobacter metabolipauper TaxID=425513 RepID=A0A4R6SZT9_9SPHI|nr:peptidoglycan DD-metalloendopeptidase family protein [Pedobacter metabolipauper]TDQ10065.1 septal ring factor EnvC (AmiA/AmiB activator) [Pedobacter metabolipauper]